jgi:hypothetical protein
MHLHPTGTPDAVGDDAPTVISAHSGATTVCAAARGGQAISAASAANAAPHLLAPRMRPSPLSAAPKNPPQPSPPIPRALAL